MLPVSPFLPSLIRFCRRQSVSVIVNPFLPSIRFCRQSVSAVVNPFLSSSIRFCRRQSVSAVVNPCLPSSVVAAPLTSTCRSTSGPRGRLGLCAGRRLSSRTASTPINWCRTSARRRGTRTAARRPVSGEDLERTELFTTVDDVIRLQALRSGVSARIGNFFNLFFYSFFLQYPVK